MSGQHLTTELRLACGLIALATAAFVFSCRLTAFEAMTLPSGQSVAARLFGSSCAIVGDHFYAEADRYFHSGVGRFREVKARKDWFFRIDGLLHPSTHTHLARHKVADILPWLKLATRINPGRSEPYLVSAYWLGQLGDYEAALTVLAEARRHVPLSEEIALETGRLLLHQGNDDAAYRCFMTCIALAERKAPDDDNSRGNLRAALLYKASLDKRRTDASALERSYKRITELFPEEALSHTATNREGTNAATGGRSNQHHAEGSGHE